MSSKNKKLVSSTLSLTPPTTNFNFSHDKNKSDHRLNRTDKISVLRQHKINFYYQNCRGLNSKLLVLLNNISSFPDELHLICLTETWLS